VIAGTTAGAETRYSGSDWIAWRRTKSTWSPPSRTRHGRNSGRGSYDSMGTPHARLMLPPGHSGSCSPVQQHSCWQGLEMVGSRGDISALEGDPGRGPHKGQPQSMEKL
jgi:hypothetical protein